MPQNPVDALEVRAPDAVPEIPIEEILFPALENLTPGIARRLDEKLNAISKLPENRERAGALLQMRRQGYTIRQIARGLGLSDTTVKFALKRARAAGLLNDTAETLAFEAGPLAAEVVVGHLKKKSEKSAHKVLEGLGHFRNYSHAKHEGGVGVTMPALQVNVVFQAGATPLAGTVLDDSEAAVGVPRRDV